MVRPDLTDPPDYAADSLRTRQLRTEPDTCQGQRSWHLLADSLHIFRPTEPNLLDIQVGSDIRASVPSAIRPRRAISRGKPRCARGVKGIGGDVERIGIEVYSSESVRTSGAWIETPSAVTHRAGLHRQR